jgi:hypothetical protein
MCEGSAIQDIAGVDAIQALEYYGIPFTGGNSLVAEI